MKKIISALLAGGMLLSSVSAMASDVNITINGEEFIPKNALGEVVSPFIENGSTYLPVRAMSEVSGKEVSFDAENYAVYIGVAPMAQSVEEYPYVKIEDMVFTEGFVNLNYRAADFISLYKLNKLVEEKLAKGLITENDIAMEKKLIMFARSITEENLEEIAKNNSITVGELNRQLYYLACQEVLLKMVEVPESEYAKYVTVKHILVEDENVAKSIVEKLNEGARFDALIEEFNTDPGQSKGSSYTFTYGDMVESFEKASFALADNEYTTQPVKSDFGYHIILKLPLKKENVDLTNYRYEKVFNELSSIPDPEKMVYVSGDGDGYGVIENITITNREFESVGVMLDTNYPDGFEYIKEMFAIIKVCENGFLTKEEVESAKNVDISALASEIPGISEEFATKYMVCLNMVSMVEDKFIQRQNAYIDFENLLREEVKNIEAHLIRDIRVYVDGEILIPSDVNNNYVRPMNIDGTVYVPVRAIVEALGMSADWDNNNRCVVITK